MESDSYYILKHIHLRPPTWACPRNVARLTPLAAPGTRRAPVGLLDILGPGRRLSARGAAGDTAITPSTPVAPGTVNYKCNNSNLASTNILLTYFLCNDKPGTGHSPRLHVR